MLNTATPTWQRDFVVDRADATRPLDIWWLITNDNLDVEDEALMANETRCNMIFSMKISSVGRDPESISRIFALQQRIPHATALCDVSVAQFKALTATR
jgi:hypothetical protein